MTTNTQATAIKLIINEMERGLKKFGPYNSRHEAYAVIFEEVEELWNEIKIGQKTTLHGLDIDEAIQVSATTLRYIIEFKEEKVDYDRTLAT